MALVLPKLVSNYKKNVVVNELKNSYSILNQAVLQSVSENEDYRNWDYSNTERFVENYILPYLKTVKICGAYSRKNGCFKSMPDGMDGWMQLDGSYSYPNGHAPNEYYKFILENGMSVAIKVAENSAAKFVVDVDGPTKGKGRLGEDVFFFQMLNGNQVSYWFIAKGNPLIPGSECANGAPHINQSVDTLLDGKKCKRGGCSLSSSNANGRAVGEACSAVIIKNNWKIPDNYPIRF